MGICLYERLEGSGVLVLNEDWDLGLNSVARFYVYSFLTNHSNSFASAGGNNSFNLDISKKSWSLNSKPGMTV